MEKTEESFASLASTDADLRETVISSFAEKDWLDWLAGISSEYLSKPITVKKMYPQEYARMIRVIGSWTEIIRRFRAYQSGEYVPRATLPDTLSGPTALSYEEMKRCTDKPFAAGSKECKTPVAKLRRKPALATTRQESGNNTGRQKAQLGDKKEGSSIGIVTHMSETGDMRLKHDKNPTTQRDSSASELSDQEIMFYDAHIKLAMPISEVKRAYKDVLEEAVGLCKTNYKMLTREEFRFYDGFLNEEAIIKYVGFGDWQAAERRISAEWERVKREMDAKADALLAGTKL